MPDAKSGKGGGPGPFELGRCHEVDSHLGSLHESRNVATGTLALTLIPREDVEWQPGGACRMSLIYEPERDSVTVDVEQGARLGAHVGADQPPGLDGGLVQARGG